MPGPFVRDDVWALPEDDPIITAYAGAVASMQAKSVTDPTSWAYQANIHGTTTSSGPSQWNNCQHASWYFTAWHRMYLYFFERIVRAEVIANGGPSTWALPYWNYDNFDRATIFQPYSSLPLAFRQPTNADGTANPLYTANRNPGINSGALLPSSVTSTTAAMACTSFTGATEFGGGISTPIQFDSATGQLESQPHNVVHTSIGGLMGDPLTAANDPIFWLHHANIDRIWWLWQQIHPGDPTAAQWLNQAFDFFDVGGVPVSLTGADVVDITTQLDYTYALYPWFIPIRFPILWRWPWLWVTPEAVVPLIPQPTPPEIMRYLIGGSEGPVVLIGDQLAVSLNIDERATEALRTGPGAGNYENRAFIELENIEAERDPGIVYEVYLNLPGEATAHELEAHRIGAVSFFGVERARDPRGDEHAHGLRYSLEVTSVLDRLAGTGSWEDATKLEIAFTPLGLEPPPDRPDLAEELIPARHPDFPVTIGRVGVYFA